MTLRLAILPRQIERNRRRRPRKPIFNEAEIARAYRILLAERALKKAGKLPAVVRLKW